MFANHDGEVTGFDSKSDTNKLVTKQATVRRIFA